MGPGGGLVMAPILLSVAVRWKPVKWHVNHRKTKASRSRRYPYRNVYQYSHIYRIKAKVRFLRKGAKSSLSCTVRISNDVWGMLRCTVMPMIGIRVSLIHA
jgi:hypothetical protein